MPHCSTPSNNKPSSNQKTDENRCNHNTVYILRRNSGTGGAERAAERLAHQLEQHFNVHRLWAGKTFQGKIIPGNSGPPWWRSWRYTDFIDRLQLKNSGLVISLEYGPNCHIYRAGDGIHRLNVKRRYGKSIAWVLNPWHWFAPMQERKCLNNAQIIVANSNLVAQLLKQEYPHLAHKVERVYNGFDSTVFNTNSEDKIQIRKNLNLPTEGKVLLFAGHGYKRKGLHHAIELLCILKHNFSETTHLVVIGKGDSSYVQDTINTEKLEKYIHFHGAVTKMSRYFHLADVMILPTRHDPFSNACLEALACGCPIITSSQNGVAEIINSETGFVFNKYNKQEFESAAKFVINASAQPHKVAATVEGLEQSEELSSYITLIKRLRVMN